MTEIKSFKDVIDLWPSLNALASDIGVPTPAVSKWRQRKSIPADRWSSILSTERARNAGVTSDKLTELAALRELRRVSA